MLNSLRDLSAPKVYLLLGSLYMCEGTISLFHSCPSSLNRSALCGGPKLKNQNSAIGLPCCWSTSKRPAVASQMHRPDTAGSEQCLETGPASRAFGSAPPRSPKRQQPCSGAGFLVAAGLSSWMRGGTGAPGCEFAETKGTASRAELPHQFLVWLWAVCRMLNCLPHSQPLPTLVL